MSQVRFRLPDYSWQELAKQWQQEANFNYNCQEAKLADQLFLPPEDVEFVDFTKIMTGLEQIGQQLEEGAETGEQPDMTEIEKQIEDLNIGISSHQEF